MGLFDTLAAAAQGLLGEAESSGAPDLLHGALAQTDLGGLQGVVTKLRDAGFGEQIESWIGSGQNIPISAEQLKSVLSEEHVQQLARHFGVDPDAALGLLAQFLPAAVEARPAAAADEEIPPEPV
jgi:uncharacterized protein YidB (DUF937 family)